MAGKGAGFGLWDWLVLAGYFLSCTAFGLWMSRKVRTSGGYFLGERKLPWWIMIGQAFGTGTHAENPVAQAGATFQFGFATIWYQWKNMLITPFYWLMAPWYRRSERTTIGEIIEDRYGRALALLYTLFAIALFRLQPGGDAQGGGQGDRRGHRRRVISPNGVVLAMAVAFMLYSFFGGLMASAYTDFVQGFLIIVLSFMLIPCGLHEVGGIRGMRQRLPAELLRSLQQASGVDAFTIAMLALNGLVGITAQPHMLTMCATGQRERAGRVGQTYGSLVKRFCTIGWAFTGLIVAAMVVPAGDLICPTRKTPSAMPACTCCGPGWVGLMVACVAGGQHVGLLELHGQHRRTVHPQHLQGLSRPDGRRRAAAAVGRLSGLG